MCLKNKSFKYSSPVRMTLSCNATNQIKPLFLPSLSYLPPIGMADSKMEMRFWKYKKGTEGKEDNMT